MAELVETGSPQARLHATLAPRPARSRTFCAIIAAALAPLAAACGGGGSSPRPDAGGAADAAAGIGPAGGTVRSADGLVTIDIPAGALAAVTPVAIQPIAGSTAPGGLGNAVRILPEGTTLAVPARLTFALTPADLAGTTLDGIGVGFLGTDGVWRSILDVTRSATAVSVATTHFSEWSALAGWQLRPPEKRVRPGEVVFLEVLDCEPAEVDEDLLIGLVPECTEGDALAPHVTGWAVDGIPGGNATVGRLLNVLGDVAQYQAPPNAGPEQTHAVSVELLPLRTHPKVLLVSNITVEGGTTYSVVGQLNLPGVNMIACQLATSSWMKDGVRFKVTRGSDGTWASSDLVNQPTEYDRELQPLPGLRSVSMVTDPDVFNASTVTVTPAGASSALIDVLISATETTGGCVGTTSDGEQVPMPSQSFPNPYVFYFDSAKQTQTVGLPTEGWYFVITRE